MLLYMIRHGDPNYKDNCLTPLGHLQAEALAERSPAFEASALFTSKYGRASETAEHTANKLGMPVTTLDFIHEINYGRPEITDPEEKKKYSPWIGTAILASEGKELMHYDWEHSPLWEGNYCSSDYTRVTEGFDKWIETIGYKREGLYYRVISKNKERRPVIFAHGGSITFVLSHLFNLPPLFATNMMRIDCTGITVVEFKGNNGDLCCPRLRTFNDHDHIKGLAVHDNSDNPQ